jgi:predicted O-methyltransferase YrrM
MSIHKNKKVISTLESLHKKASRDNSKKILNIPSINNFQSMSPKEKSEIMKELYMAVDQEQGELLYTLARGSNAKSIFEFGTSFGISAIYLGTAALENKGKVLTTELNEEKCKIALNNIQNAGLKKVITIVQGDALDTIRNSNIEFDFVFLDGWKEMYLPVLKLLEKKLKKGSIIIADNVSFAQSKPYLNYVKTHKKFVSTTLTLNKDDTELSYFV